MKILIIRPYPSYINLSDNSYNSQELGLAKSLIDLGFETDIVYFGKVNEKQIVEYQEKSIAIYYLKPKFYFKSIAVYPNFDDLKEKYDILVCDEYDQIETYKTIKKYSNKTIIYHGTYYSSFNRNYNIYNKLFDILLLQKIKRINPCIFTKSKLSKNFLIEKGLEVREVVGVGLDSSALMDREINSNSYSKEENKDIKLLYIGKIEKRRNIFFLIKLLKDLNTNNSRDYILTIIGDGKKSYIKKINKFIKKCQLDDKVKWINKCSQNEISQYYLNSDLFLLPTNYEIWGMVIMEAMYFNLPIITTKNGGSSVLVKDYINGNISELDLQKWKYIIDNVKYNKKKIELKNKELLKEKCDWRNIAEKVILYYQMMK